MMLRIPAKVLLHVWSYDFYDMTLSTGKQQRHMIIHNYRSYILNKHFSLCIVGKSIASKDITVVERCQVVNVDLTSLQ